VVTSEPANICRVSGDPQAHCEQWLAALPVGSEAMLVVDFELPQYWLDGSPSLPLSALYYRDAACLRVAVTQQPLPLDEKAAAAQFEYLVSTRSLLVAVAGQPVPLVPRPIPKPWGREVWYSAVEQRGVCDAGTEVAQVPLPWLMAALPGGAYPQPLILLKILEPDNSAVTGDLYFELHRQKHEVYVVTHVDQKAWPDGIGYLRYGFSESKLAQYAGEAAFRAAYLAAVQAYETVRRHIDDQLRGQTPDEGILREEASLRAAMDEFTHLMPVTVDQVIYVPPWLPHALQHGVRTVEFQTPVYEREILSFAQRVLTQDHWDTATVVQQMQLLPDVGQTPELLQREPGVLVERVVDFAEFEVLRIILEPGANFTLSILQAYGLLLILHGEITLGGHVFTAEQGLWLPGLWSAAVTAPQAAPGLVLLLALPRQ